MATHNDGSRLLHRVTRDLRAPMALLIASHPRRHVVEHLGFEDTAAVRSLVAVDAHRLRSSDETGLSGIRSWAAAPVEHDGLEVGTLLVADRRRRWFDDEEIRHLGLMTCVAANALSEVTALDLDTVDVRGIQAPVASLA